MRSHALPALALPALALPVLAALALAACKSPPPRDETTVSTVNTPGPGDAGAAPAASTAAHGERAFLLRTPAGELIVAQARSASDLSPGAGELVGDLGPAAVLGKLGNPAAVLGRLARGKGDAQTSLFVKLDLARAPADEAGRRAALQAAGVAPQTLAGDVATLLVAPTHLGALLALPWVVSVEAPGIAVPR